MTRLHHQPARRQLVVLALALGGVSLAGAGATSSASVRSATHPVARCAAGSLRASFALLPGSEGAGNVVYLLRLVNTARTTCSVSGLPELQLLSRAGAPLASRVVSARLGTDVTVPLRPGASAWSSARFSPDVPGPGESGTHACEPTAYAVRILAGALGAVTAAVAPPTPVCEHGTMQLSYLSAKKPNL